MSVLRCAARKLVGLRTLAAAATSPVVQAAERWLLGRLIHSGRPTGVVHPATHDDWLAHLHLPPNQNKKTIQIQQELHKKKEELYNLLAEVERNAYYTDNGARVIRQRHQNIKLLQHLSVQVNPKPNDRKWYNIILGHAWRWYKISHKLNFYWIYAASIITGLKINTLRHHTDGTEEEGLEGKNIALGDTNNVEEQKVHAD